MLKRKDLKNTIRNQKTVGSLQFHSSPWKSDSGIWPNKGKEEIKEQFLKKQKLLKKSKFPNLKVIACPIVATTITIT